MGKDYVDTLDTGDEDWADAEDPCLQDPTTAFHPAGCDCEGCADDRENCPGA